MLPRWYAALEKKSREDIMNDYVSPFSKANSL